MNSFNVHLPHEDIFMIITYVLKDSFLADETLETDMFLGGDRTMTMARTQAGRMVMQIPLLERTKISALAGGVAGGFVSATLHPIDTVKTKLQTRGASEVYSGPLDVVTNVIYLPSSIYFLLFSACMHCYSSTCLVLQVMDGVCAKCSSSILLFDLYFSV